MKRLIYHFTMLSCLFVLTALVPGMASAADSDVSDAVTEISELSVPENKTFSEPLVIKPTSGTVGIVNVSSGATATFDDKAIISGTGMDLAKTGSGNMHLNADNTYTGDTYIYGGKLLVGKDSALGGEDGSVGINGGTFRAKDTFSTARTFVLGSNGGLFEVANTSTLTIDGQIAGNGALTMVQNGALVLTNAQNSFSGGLNIHTGSVKLTSAGAAGTGDITLYSREGYDSYPGTLDLSFGSDATLSNSILLDHEGTDSDRVSGIISKNEDTTVTLSGAQVQSNFLEVNEGDLKVTNTLESRNIDVAQGSTLTVGTLRLADAMTLAVNNEGTFTYNRLEVVGSGNKVSSSSLPSAAGKTLSFVLDSNTAKNDVMLSVDGDALDVTGSIVKLAANGELSKLSKGDTVTLIDKTTGQIASADGTIEYGATTYTVATTQTADSLSRADTDIPLTLTVEDIQTTGGKKGAAKAYLESALASLYTVAGANQFMGTVGIREAVKSSLEMDERNDVSATVAFRGTYQDVDTGSSIKGWTYNLLGAMTYKMRNSLGLSRVGLFGEGGWGRFDTKNRFSGRRVTGDADVSYAGAGALLRHDLPIGLYGEGTFRVGRVDGDFSSGNMGADASYESDRLYYGGHLGLGYLYYFSEKHELDLFGKVFWTHTNSDSVRTDAGERLRIDSADSLVSHLGARYSATLPWWDLVFHVAGGWEHEFDGEQKGKLDGRKVNAPDMGGSSGVGEIGLRWMPQQTGFYMDLAAHGSLGQRDSVGGNVNLGYEF